jgi:hypothetical protein
MSKFSMVLAGLVGVASLATASAQDIFPVQSITYAGQFDVASNTFFPSNIDPDTLPGGDAGNDLLYDNSTTNGFLSTSGGAVVTNHHMDWGDFQTGGGNGANLTEIRVAYATNLLAAAGAPGLRVRIYDGATGFGVQGTIIGDYLIGPLPNSVSGGYEGFLIDVTLPASIFLNDGPVGWSYNIDNPPGALTSATGILLAGPPNGPGAGAAHGQTFGSYDRYTEASDAYVGTFQGAGPAMLSFVIRLRGREVGGGGGPWVNYGVKNKVTLTGAGSALPGSVDNVITIKNNPGGKPVVLVAGITQSDVFAPNLQLHFYALPWLMQLAPIQTPVIDGTVMIPAPLDISIPSGLVIYMQAFGQNLTNTYKNWSEGLQLTIQ